MSRILTRNPRLRVPLPIVAHPKRDLVVKDVWPVVPSPARLKKGVLVNVERFVGSETVDHSVGLDASSFVCVAGGEEGLGGRARGGRGGRGRGEEEVLEQEQGEGEVEDLADEAETEGWHPAGLEEYGQGSSVRAKMENWREDELDACPVNACAQGHSVGLCNSTRFTLPGHSAQLLPCSPSAPVNDGPAEIQPTRRIRSVPIRCSHAYTPVLTTPSHICTVSNIP